MFDCVLNTTLNSLVDKVCDKQCNTGNAVQTYIEYITLFELKGRHLLMIALLYDSI